MAQITPEQTTKAIHPVLGIMGGLGPAASCYLYQMITDHTPAQKDQDHIDIVISSRASTPDRTAFIVGKSKDDPFDVMEQDGISLVRYGATVLAIACNTAHYFLPRLQAMTSLPFLSMLEATAKTCAKDFPGQTAAILATKGTLATGLYEKALNAQGVHCLVPDEGEQDVLMHLIYDVVKASKPLEPEQGAWQALLDGLRARGADYFILGCTELPIIADTLPQPGPFVDPTAELAKAAIRICGYKVKGE